MVVCQIPAFIENNLLIILGFTIFIAFTGVSKNIMVQANDLENGHL